MVQLFASYEAARDARNIRWHVFSVIGRAVALASLAQVRAPVCQQSKAGIQCSCVLMFRR